MWRLRADAALSQEALRRRGALTIRWPAGDYHLRRERELARNRCKSGRPSSPPAMWVTPLFCPSCPSRSRPIRRSVASRAPKERQAMQARHPRCNRGQHHFARVHNASVGRSGDDGVATAAETASKPTLSGFADKTVPGFGRPVSTCWSGAWPLGILSVRPPSSRSVSVAGSLGSVAFARPFLNGFTALCTAVIETAGRVCPGKRKLRLSPVLSKQRQSCTTPLASRDGQKNLEIRNQMRSALQPRRNANPGFTGELPETNINGRRDRGKWRCSRTNANQPPLFLGQDIAHVAQRPRHSARAAPRLALQVGRDERVRFGLT